MAQCTWPFCPCLRADVAVFPSRCEGVRPDGTEWVACHREQLIAFLRLTGWNRSPWTVIGPGLFLVGFLLSVFA